MTGPSASRSFTEANWYRFVQSPGDYTSAAGFETLAISAFISRHLGVGYNMAFMEGEYNASDPRNHFLDGLLTGHGGTCVTMPVLYIAIGRRLGYPLYLVQAKEHWFVRWEGQGERFNIEATTANSRLLDDEYYHSQPRPLSPDEIARGPWLRDLGPRDVLAHFLAERARACFTICAFPPRCGRSNWRSQSHRGCPAFTSDATSAPRSWLAMYYAEVKALPTGRRTIDLRHVAAGPAPESSRVRRDFAGVREDARDSSSNRGRPTDRNSDRRPPLQRRDAVKPELCEPSMPDTISLVPVPVNTARARAPKSRTAGRWFLGRRVPRDAAPSEHAFDVTPVAGARWYLPSAERWTQPDPSGLGPDPNPNRYCGNDPVNGTDPSGLSVVVSKDLQPVMQRFFGAGNVSFVQVDNGFRVSLGPGAKAHLAAYDGDANYKAYLLAAIADSGTRSLGQVNSDYTSEAFRPGPQADPDGNRLVNLPHRGVRLIGPNHELIPNDPRCMPDMLGPLVETYMLGASLCDPELLAAIDEIATGTGVVAAATRAAEDLGVDVGASAPARPTLPAFTPGGKTSGVLRTPTGEVPLQSGWQGPASSIPRGTSGFDIVTRTHVEGHAAAAMRQQGLSEATVYINNPQICPSCSRLLPRMLPPGSRLTVVLPDGTGVTFTGVTP